MMTSWLAAPLLLATLAQGAPAGGGGVQGYRYNLHMTSDRDRELVATVREGQGRARIDFERSDDREGNDTYILLSDNGRTVVFVKPASREYTVVDDTTFERIVGRALRMVTNLGVVNIQLRDVRIVPERLGVGESIDGRPTRHYRLTQEYRAFVGAFGIVGDEPVHQLVVTDYWVAARPLLLRNPLIELLASVETALAQRSESFVRRSAAARDSLFRGTPLRVVVTASSNEHGEPKERRLELSGLQTGTFDPAIWRIPDGYTRRQGDLSFDLF